MMKWKYIENIKLWEVKNSGYEFYGSTIEEAIETMEICNRLWKLNLNL